MRLFFLFLLIRILSPLFALCQPETDTLLERILIQGRDSLVQVILNNKDSFRVQIIYTQINRDKKNNPSFRNYYFNVDSNLYYNPASTVKLPLALLSLEKLNRLHKKKVNKYTAMQFDSSYPRQKKLYEDSTSATGLPSIAHFIKKAFLVSDNDAYNRMFQFVGPQEINRNLHAKGYSSTRITRQFMGFTEEENRHTNAIRFIHPDGSLIYKQPPAYNPDPIYFNKIINIGKGHYNQQDSLVMEPIDFSKANHLPLEDLQQILQSVMFPVSMKKKQRFDLTKEDYKFLYQYLSQYPSDTNYPKYDSTQYYDSYVKFYFRDSSHRMPSNVRVFNKVGWAYGFLIDVSYVADFKNKVEFMLTSTVYVNSNGILNDNEYDYGNTGWPFMNAIGQIIYGYELKRQRKYPPKLDAFRINYEKRDPSDKRPVVRDVDN